MSISFVIPAWRRPQELAITLQRIGARTSDEIGDGAELIVVDNASDPPIDTPTRLSNGVGVELIRMDHNAGAAARNVGAAAASGDWLVMLDDDSSPQPCPLAATLGSVPDDVAAVGGEIRLPNGAREAGGLPEVVIGCGCAIRRRVFIDVGGYDPAFDYYAEEYDLCARLILRGDRVRHTRALQFEHRKAATARAFDRILHRLVRNNGWTIARYAPSEVLDSAVSAMLERYAAIGVREGAERGYAAGLAELDATRADQPRRPMSDAQWARFTGADAAARGLQSLVGAAVQLVDEGKGADVIRAALHAIGADVRPSADRRVIGCLSPGPMLDASDRRGADAIAPWNLAA